MSWLQGGPFLEVTFVLELETNRQSFVETLFNKLKSFIPRIEFATSENELQKKLAEFYEGYPNDETDPNTIIYHQTQIPVYVDTGARRKSILALQQISQELITVEFWFYGDKSDVPEWGQPGIAAGEVYIFKDMLHSLFDTFHFAIGTVGYEHSVTDLFNTKETWPDESYNLDNVDKRSVQVEDYFVEIICNKNHFDLQGINGTKMIGDKIVLQAKS